MEDKLKFMYRIHAIERMFERDISEQDIESVVFNGEVIKNYPNDKPYPSRLSLGFIKKRPVHLVYSLDDQENIIVITVYEPEPDKWYTGFKKRKK